MLRRFLPPTASNRVCLRLLLLSSPNTVARAATALRYCAGDASTSVKHSWGFVPAEELDASGRTAMDRRFDAAVEQARARFSDPIAVPNAPTSAKSGGEGDADAAAASADFLVGFTQYRWSLRESYRAAIAMAANEILVRQQRSRRVAPEQIELSVAWTGRFAVNKFRGLHKVLGVTLLEPNTAEGASTTNAAGNAATATSRRRWEDAAELKDQLVGDLAVMINEQKTKCLVEMGIVRATPRDMFAASSPASSSSSVDADDFDAAVRAVLRELRAVSKQHRVVFVMNDLTAQECAERLRPIIFSHLVSPLMINVDDIGRGAPSPSPPSDKEKTREGNDDEETLLLRSADSFPKCLPPALFDAAERRQVVLAALGQQFRRSVLDVSGGNGKKSREQDDSSTGGGGSSLRLPMIFINGAYLGGSSHLISMQQSASKLKMIIHSPTDARMK